MLLPLLATLAALAAQATPSELGAATRAFFERGPGYLPPEGLPDPQAMAGGAPIFQGRQPVPGFPGLWVVELRNTGSGYREKFLFYAPPNAAGTQRPALVVFHRFNVGFPDALYNTSFFQEAQARGWYFLAPNGAFQNNYGCAAAQINTQAMLTVVAGACPTLDRGRIFGVGFSMGGGWALAQAARHVDVDGLRFAALVDHSGSVSLAHVHASEPGVRSILEGLLGGTPAQVPFEYQRYSTIDLDPLSLQIGAGTDLARNLVATPLLLWETLGDPMWDLRKQTYALQGDLLARGAAPRLHLVRSNQHAWSTLDDHAVCEWLAHVPGLSDRVLDGELLADADGAWFHFRLEQDNAGGFTSLSWSADPAANRLALTGSTNLRRVHLDARDLGLGYLGDLRIDHRAADALGDEIVIEGLASGAPPQWVRLNGAPMLYVYDPQAGTLTLPALNGTQTDRWQVHF